MLNKNTFIPTKIEYIFSLKLLSSSKAAKTIVMIIVNINTNNSLGPLLSQYSRTLLCANPFSVSKYVVRLIIYSV